MFNISIAINWFKMLCCYCATLHITNNKWKRHMTTPFWEEATGHQWIPLTKVQYIPRNMHMVFALLCFVVVIHWLIFPYPSGLLHWHCGNLTIAPVPAKQPWWIWINTSCEFIMNDCITTTKQSTKKPCAYFLGYTVHRRGELSHIMTPSWWMLVKSILWLVQGRNFWLMHISFETGQIFVLCEPNYMLAMNHGKQLHKCR